MFLTAEEIDYIFNSTPPHLPNAETPPLFGYSTEDIEYGKKLFTDIDTRLKSEWGLPIEHSATFVDVEPIKPIRHPFKFREYIDGVDIDNIDEVFRLEFTPAKIGKEIIPNHYNPFKKNHQIHLPCSIYTPYSTGTQPYNQQLYATTRPQLLSNLIDQNIILMKRFLHHSKISRYNIDSLTQKQFERKCKRFFGNKIEVTPRMFVTFKNFVRTSNLTNDFDLSTYSLYLKKPGQDVSTYAATRISQKTAAVEVMGSICENAGKNLCTGMIDLYKKANASLEKNISFSVPVNANEMMSQKFTSFEELSNFINSITTDEKMFVDIDNLTVYVVPETSEFDTVDSPNENFDNYDHITGQDFNTSYSTDDIDVDTL